MRTALGIGLLCCLLLQPGAVSAQDDDPDVEPMLQGDSDCIRASTLRDFEILDDRNLLVLAGRRRAGYRIQLAPGCFGLRQSLGISFQSRSGRICGFPGEYLIVGQDFRVVGPRQRPARSEDLCPIRGVQRLEPEAMHEVRVRFGKVPPLPPVPESEVEIVEEARDPGEPPERVEQIIEE